MIKNYTIIFLLGLFSFGINFYVGSRGVYPVDTFIHYDYGYRILLGDNPIKDYWIIHGFIIDYIQAFFFKFFGNSWHSYLIHSSLFNAFIVLASFQVFKTLKINIYLSLILSFFIAILAYPVSGTPFLDLHSAFFSILGIYCVILAIIKNNYIYWSLSSIFLCLAFFSKQVPAGYVIICVSFINLYLLLDRKSFKPLIYYSTGALLFLLSLGIFLFLKKISFQDFILQVFLFPQSIGGDRYSSYGLNFHNVFLNFKFIHIVLIMIIFINFYNLIKIKEYYRTDKFYIFLIILSYSFSMLTHQIYTKNQIYIFYLIPVLSGFFFYYLANLNYRFDKILTFLIIILCIGTTIKYNKRFNIERKFHELSSVNFEDTIELENFDNKLKGLKWISPYYQNPKTEINNILKLYNLLLKDEKNKMLISEYNFFSSILEEKLYSPSRTYDDISFPKKNSKYFTRYKYFFTNIIKKNKINNIYIFEPIEITEDRLNFLVFNYISKNCFDLEQKELFLIILKTKSCGELN